MCCIEKLPSINPANQASLSKDPNLIANLLILILWLLFNQSIKRCNWFILGVLSSPLIKLIVLTNPFIAETVSRQALF